MPRSLILFKMASKKGGEIYHEKQSLRRCAIHALNNLFQDQNAFSKEILDKKCYDLAPDAFINPHKNVLGLGNYDVNVLMAVLQSRGFEAIWFDKRRGLDTINFHQVFGLMLNVPSSLEIFGHKINIGNFKHWFTVRAIEGQYYNLDSKVDKAVILGSVDCMKKFIASLLQRGSTELLLIVEADVAMDVSWRRCSEYEKSESIITD